MTSRRAAFASSEWDSVHPIPPRDTTPTPHIDALNRLVSIESGHAVAQWFERTPSGEGVALPITGFPELNDRVLQPDSFPEALIRDTWTDCHEAALVSDYLNWLAPVLLTLQSLCDKRRAALEAQAKLRATEVEKVGVFYPKIIDRGAIDTARVEARLINTLYQKGVGDK